MHAIDRQISSALMLALCLTLAACGKLGSRPAKTGVTDTLLIAAGEGEWLSYGRDYGEQRFSTLTRINDKNVGKLGLTWSAELDTARGQEATPLMHDGVLYVSTAWSMVKAYDAKTGTLKWSYDPKVPRETLARACCDAVNRGVALYGDKLYVGTLDGRLVALDQKSGKVVFEKIVVPNQKDYTITGAPRAAMGKVFLGSGGAEFKARGYLAAYDAETGDEIWKFHTVPGNPSDGFENEAMKKAAKTWAGKWWELGGGGTVWDSITYDPRTNLIFFGTGNAEPWNPAAARRQGDSLYTSSIVAVNADTGEYAWHFQETPEDRWDFDSNAQITIADIDIDGTLRHVIMHAPKNGFFYILDAKTGEFLSATPFVPQNWASAIDPKTGKATVNPEARYERTGKPFFSQPGSIGAHSWNSQSYSPKAGLVYIPANLVGGAYLAAKDWKPSGIGFQIGIDGAALSMPADKRIRKQAMESVTGALIAWDPLAKREAWRVSHDGPWNGGTLATAGNLVFQGTAKGDFIAYSADTGAKLWSFWAQTGIIAAPMTYAIEGEQYVAILVGWGGVYDIAAGVLAHKSGSTQNISRLLVFKLGGKEKLAPPPPSAKRVLDPPALSGAPEQFTKGAGIFARYCAVCHGDAAIAGGLTPDLRHSATLNNPNIFKAIVMEGQLSKGGGNGMVSFRSVLTNADAEAIRHFLIKRAHEDKALGQH